MGVIIHVKIDSSLSRPDSFSRSQIEFRFTLPIQFNEELNDNVTDDASVIPYMRHRTSSSILEGLKPYTNVFMYVDGERVDHRFVSLPQGLVFEDVNITGSQFEIGETVSQVTNVGTKRTSFTHSNQPQTELLSS